MDLTCNFFTKPTVYISWVLILSVNLTFFCGNTGKLEIISFAFIMTKICIHICFWICFCIMLMWWNLRSPGYTAVNGFTAFHWQPTRSKIRPDVTTMLFCCFTSCFVKGRIHHLQTWKNITSKWPQNNLLHRRYILFPRIQWNYFARCHLL